MLLITYSVSFQNVVLLSVELFQIVFYLADMIFSVLFNIHYFRHDYSPCISLIINVYNVLVLCVNL